MKYFKKIIAAMMAALTIAASSTAIVSAAEVKNRALVKVISCKGCGDIETLLKKACKGADCGNIETLLKEACKGRNCGLTALMPKGFCPGGNCVTKKPVTTGTTAKPAEQVSGEFNTAYEAEVLRLVNAERSKNGLTPLSYDSGATNVAHLRAKEIVKSFSHTRPDGSSCFTAAKELGVTYRSAGENIAYGYSSPKQVVNGWMNSQGHRRNILSKSFTKIGIGCRKSGKTLYWSQFFIG